MCNIAGYVGDRPAAPILIEMMRRQEGLAGGFYTGIATIHQGKLHYAKLTGDLDRLLMETNAGALRGNIGILHSRSNSGGGDEWAHPFIGLTRNVPRTAYVANGCIGCFAPRRAHRDAIAAELLTEGYTFTSRTSPKEGRYSTLPDGTAVHISDVMCQLILRNIQRGADEAQAMADAFCQMPAEIVGLLLSIDRPERIFFSRINYPMMVGFAPHGVYLGSAALSFPNDAERVQSLPPLSSGSVDRNGLTVKPLAHPPVDVAAVDESLVERAAQALSEQLSGQEMTFSQLRKLLGSLLDGATCLQESHLGYEALRALHRSGKLSIRTERVQGAAEGLTAPKFMFGSL